MREALPQPRPCLLSTWDSARCSLRKIPAYWGKKIYSNYLQNYWVLKFWKIYHQGADEPSEASCSTDSVADCLAWSLAGRTHQNPSVNQNPSEISKTIPCWTLLRNISQLHPATKNGLFVASIHRITFGLDGNIWKSASERILSFTNHKFEGIGFSFLCFHEHQIAHDSIPQNPQNLHFHLLHMTQLEAPDHNVCQIDTRQTDHLHMTSQKTRKQRRKQQWSEGSQK